MAERKKDTLSDYWCSQFRPTKEELGRLLDEMPMTKLGEKYRVSDNAVRKWCREYGIELPNRLGYWAKLRAARKTISVSGA
jgi:uncharacterized protein YjcR